MKTYKIESKYYGGHSELDEGDFSFVVEVEDHIPPPPFTEVSHGHGHTNDELDAVVSWFNAIPHDERRVIFCDVGGKGVFFGGVVAVGQTDFERRRGYTPQGVLVVGRHEFGDSARACVAIEVGNPFKFERVNPTFRSVADVEDLLREARAQGLVVVFQATAPHVAVALARMAREDRGLVGIVFSVPGARPTARKQSFVSERGETIMCAVEFVNPRAHVEVQAGEQDVVVVTVESPMPFEFDRIEWIS